RHVFQALDLTHGGELVDELGAVHRFGRILVLDLRDHQGEEIVLQLGRVTDVDPLLHRFVDAVVRTALTVVEYCGHQTSPSLSRPCCMLFRRLSTSTPVSKLRVADIMSVISSIWSILA